MYLDGGGFLKRQLGSVSCFSPPIMYLSEMETPLPLESPSSKYNFCVQAPVQIF